MSCLLAPRSSNLRTQLLNHILGILPRQRHVLGVTAPRKDVALLGHEAHGREGERLAELVAGHLAEDLGADCAAAAEVGDVEVGADACAEEAAGGDGEGAAEVD